LFLIDAEKSLVVNRLSIEAAVWENGKDLRAFGNREVNVDQLGLPGTYLVESNGDVDLDVHVTFKAWHGEALVGEWSKVVERVPTARVAAVPVLFAKACPSIDAKVPPETVRSKALADYSVGAEGRLEPAAHCTDTPPASVLPSASDAGSSQPSVANSTAIPSEVSDAGVKPVNDPAEDAGALSGNGTATPSTASSGVSSAETASTALSASPSVTLPVATVSASAAGTQAPATPSCGDGFVSAPEVCDSGGRLLTDLGECNPDCSGYYEKKYLRVTSSGFANNTAGLAGADAKCVGEFGQGWKALLVGGARRATVTPLVGDGQLDWVLHKYTHYYNADDALVWRTDRSALLGVRDGKRQNLYAAAFDDKGSNVQVWSGYDSDWTTFPDALERSVGTCNAWTGQGYGVFTNGQLTTALSDYCTVQWSLLCVQQ
jgi:Protein of unknown function (DUF1554)